MWLQGEDNFNLRAVSTEQKKDDKIGSEVLQASESFEWTSNNTVDNLWTFWEHKEGGI